MQFNIRQGNYANAGKATADDMVRSFAAARRNAPDYGKMAQQAQSIRSKVKQEGIKAATDVTKLGIQAAGKMEALKIEEGAKRKLGSARRKAGALGAAGKLFGTAGSYLGEKRTKREVGSEDSYFDSEIAKAEQKARELREKANNVGVDTQDPSTNTPNNSSGGTSSENTSGSSGGASVSSNVSAQHSASSGGVMTKSDIHQLAIDTGFTPEQARTVVGIAGGESGFDPSNSTRRSGLYAKTGEDSVGLMQINWGYHKDSGWLQGLGINSREDLLDPVNNMKAAKYLYDGRGGFGDWTVYNKGIYQDYL